MTPLPSFEPLGAQPDPQQHFKAHSSPGETGGGPGRGILMRASALLSVSGLLGALVAPSAFALAAPQETATMFKEQTLSASDAPLNLDALAEVSAVEAAPIPTPVPASQMYTERGLIDLGRLAETKLKYPFNQTMPLTDGFGYRTEPVAQFHDAQDIAAANGTPIRSIGNGIVIEAGWASDGCGFSLKIQHKVNGQSLTSRYCHMESESHSWKVGDPIKLGDQVGRVGNTGMSFGSHLHLALRLNGEPIDPLPYIESNST